MTSAPASALPLKATPRQRPSKSIAVDERVVAGGRAVRRGEVAGAGVQQFERDAVVDEAQRDPVRLERLEPEAARAAVLGVAQAPVAPAVGLAQQVGPRRRAGPSSSRASGPRSAARRAGTRPGRARRTAGSHRPRAHWRCARRRTTTSGVSASLSPRRTGRNGPRVPRSRSGRRRANAPATTGATRHAATRTDRPAPSERRTQPGGEAHARGGAAEVIDARECRLLAETTDIEDSLHEPQPRAKAGPDRKRPGRRGRALAPSAGRTEGRGHRRFARQSRCPTSSPARSKAIRRRRRSPRRSRCASPSPAPRPAARRPVAGAGARPLGQNRGHGPAKQHHPARAGAGGDRRPRRPHPARVRHLVVRPLPRRAAAHRQRLRAAIPRCATSASRTAAAGRSAARSASSSGRRWSSCATARSRRACPAAQRRAIEAGFAEIDRTPP